ncbi:MAG: metalloprotease PmbA [Legionellales bacterium RIFCSPHIGHO2_12_FULL_37_14]|nr:MAG: metalloprotease PmbA [Legionellales bacterium RIFCSPHIGHO2_12_FULL_37_14]
MLKTINNNPPSPFKSIDELKDIMHLILQKARKKGASDAEVCIEQDCGYSVDVRLKQVETVNFSNAQSIALTLYIGKQKGSASSTELNSTGLEQIVDAALDIAKVSAKDPCFGLADKELLTSKHPDIDLYHPWRLNTEEAILLCKQCEEVALADKNIVNSDGVGLANFSGAFGYANTHGAEGIIYSSRHSLSCSLVGKKKDMLQRDYAYSTARDPSNLETPEHIAEEAVGRTVKRLGAKKIKTQKAPILFEARVASHLIAHFLHAISGGALYRKQTFLVDSLGKQIFPANVHIQEHPYLQGALGSSSFDAEGVTTRDNIFVKAGIVNQYVLSSYTARRLGLHTTANAGGVHNLEVSGTHPDLNSLLKLMDRGLLVTELMGNGVNIQNGDYSKGAFGYWVEKGKIKHPVEEITIAGNLQNMFQQIIGIGKDHDKNHATRCGSILIESMMIAGS